LQIVLSLTILASSRILAHGGEVILPLFADLFLLLFAIVLSVKDHANWKYRFILLLGAVVVIILSWFIVDICLTDEFITYAIIEQTVFFTIAFWLLTALLYAPVYWIAKRMLLEESTTNDEGRAA